MKRRPEEQYSSHPTEPKLARGASLGHGDSYKVTSIDEFLDEGESYNKSTTSLESLGDDPYKNQAMTKSGRFTMYQEEMKEKKQELENKQLDQVIPKLIEKIWAVFDKEDDDELDKNEAR